MLKLGPSGWVMTIGLTPARVGCPDHAVDGMRPAEVVRGLLEEGEAALEPSPPLALGEHPGGERVDPELGEVGEAADAHGLEPTLVAVDHLLDEGELGQHHRDLPVGVRIERLRGDDPVLRRAHGHVVRGAGGQVDEHRAKAPRSDDPVEQLAFVLFPQAEIRNVGVGAEQARTDQDRAPRLDLTGPERRERGGDRLRLGLWGHGDLTLVDSVARCTTVNH
jgi:hypothetical protein